MTPKQVQRQERILQATRDCISQSGYEGWSMRDLADVAGVAPATLYNLFDTKDALITAALGSLLQQLYDSVPSDPDKPLEAFLAEIAAVFHQVVATPSYAAVMSRILFIAEPNDPIVELLPRRTFDRLTKEFGTMKQQGLLKATCDPKQLAKNATALTWGSLLLWTKGFTALHDLKSEVVNGVLHLLLNEATEPGHAAIEKQFL